MTLRELIEKRRNKYTSCSCSDFQKGYEEGWKWAYTDLKEILEQNNFDMDAEVTTKPNNTDIFNRLITILILTIICGITFMNCLASDLTVVEAIILSIIAVVTWLSCIILEFIEVIKTMKFIVLKCPKCGKHIGFRNYFAWVLHSPMHWFGKRYTRCGYCGKWSWMKKEK